LESCFICADIPLACLSYKEIMNTCKNKRTNQILVTNYVVKYTFSWENFIFQCILFLHSKIKPLVVVYIFGLIILSDKYLNQVSLLQCNYIFKYEVILSNVLYYRVRIWLRVSSMQLCIIYCYYMVSTCNICNKDTVK